MDIRNHVEDTINNLLQEAYTFTGPSDDVDTIWLYLSYQDRASFAQPVFSVNRTVSGAADIDDHLSEKVDSRESHRDLNRTFSRLARELVFAFEDSNEEQPTRIIARYVVSTQSLDLTMRYEPIPRDDEQTWSDVFEAWVQRLSETGEDDA